MSIEDLINDELEAFDAEVVKALTVLQDTFPPEYIELLASDGRAAIDFAVQLAVNIDKKIPADQQSFMLRAGLTALHVAIDKAVGDD